MFRQGLRIQDLQQERIRLHRDVYTMAQELGVSLETLGGHEVAEGVRLFPIDPNSEDYPGDTDVLGTISHFRRREENRERASRIPYGSYAFALLFLSTVNKGNAFVRNHQDAKRLPL